MTARSGRRGRMSSRVRSAEFYGGPCARALSLLPPDTSLAVKPRCSWQKRVAWSAPAANAAGAFTVVNKTSTEKLSIKKPAKPVVPWRAKTERPKTCSARLAQFCRGKPNSDLILRSTGFHPSGSNSPPPFLDHFTRRKLCVKIAKLRGGSVSWYAPVTSLLSKTYCVSRFAGGEHTLFNQILCVF